MAGSEATNHREARHARGARLGFRVDGETKALVERAAGVERRNLTDFCLTALADAAREAIARHETLILSDHDREVFFDTLINPPEINLRLRRAFEAERRHIEP